MPWCPDCELEKAPEEFHINSRKSNGLTTYCKDCFRIRTRDTRARRRTGTAKTPNQRRAPKTAPPGTSKRCPRCEIVKPLEEFVRNRSTKSGIGGYCRPCQNAVGKRNRERLHGSTRTYHLKRRYGLTADEVQELIDEQRGVCAICRERPAKHVDHDHETGRVRGVLCFTCNVGIANFGEDRERMRFAMIYLEIHQYIKRRESA